jgi:hypothetical protein
LSLSATAFWKLWGQQGWGGVGWTEQQPHTVSQPLQIQALKLPSYPRRESHARFPTQL